MKPIILNLTGSVGDIKVLSAVQEETQGMLRGIIITPGARTVPWAAEQIFRMAEMGVRLGVGRQAPIMKPGRDIGVDTWFGTGIYQEEAQKESFIVASTGPLTDLAVFLLAYPVLVKKLHRVIAIGGAVYGGDRTVCAEENFYEDPEAAYILNHSGVPLTLLPLEAAGECQKGEETRRALEKGLVRCILEQPGIKTERYTMEVELTKGPSRGASVIDVLNREKGLPVQEIVKGFEGEPLLSGKSAAGREDGNCG